MVLLKMRKKTKSEGVVALFVDWRNLPAVTDALQCAGWVWRGIVVWDKKSSRNTPGRYRQDCEFVVWGTNGPKAVSWEPGFEALPGCYSVPSVTTKNKHHQTEKPVLLLERLLKICKRGAVVLDPFMGSGSTGVACVKLGLDFLGSDISEHNCKVAAERIEEARAEAENVTLFDIAENEG